MFLHSLREYLRQQLRRLKKRYKISLFLFLRRSRDWTLFYSIIFCNFNILNNNIMASIKIIQPTFDAVTNQAYKVGDIINLGAQRNKRAVETNQAVWVTSKELAKEEAKADNTENTTEKVEQTQGGKKTTSLARGKKIETKSGE